MTAKSVINRMIASGTLTREDPSDVHDMLDALEAESGPVFGSAYREFFLRSALEDDNGAPLVSDASSVASFRRRIRAVSRVTGRPEEEVMSAYAARDNGDRSASDALEFMYYTR